MTNADWVAVGPVGREPRLHLKFPANREKCREFSYLGPHLRASQGLASITFQVGWSADGSSLLQAEQGIQQGNIRE
jgi:hypothetical protein